MSPALSGLDMTSMFSEKGTLMSNKEQQAEFRAKRKVQKLAGRDLKNTIYIHKNKRNGFGCLPIAQLICASVRVKMTPLFEEHFSLWIKFISLNAIIHSGKPYFRTVV